MIVFRSKFHDFLFWSYTVWMAKGCDKVRRIILELLPGIGAFLGCFTGDKFCRTLNKYVWKAGLCLNGFVGGMMISLVSFFLIPELMEKSQLLWVFIGTFMGILFSVMLEKRIIEGKWFYQYSTLLISVFVFGLCLFMMSDEIERRIFLVLFFLWCMVEAIKLTQNTKNNRPIFWFHTFIVSVICIVVFRLGEWGQMVLFLAPCGAGILLYISCGNMLPQKEAIWDNFFAAAGGIFGFFLTNILICLVK